MKRDGATISLWQETAQDATFAGANTGDAVFDVLIVGGGITGVTTALLLQKAGKQCLVAEAQNLCFGTTGGTTAHINTFLDTSYDMIRSGFGADAARLIAGATNRSRDLFQQHVEDYRIDCGFEEKDAYLYAVEEKQVAELDKIYTSSREAGVAVEYVDRIPVPVPFLKAIVYRRQAQVHPTRYVQALGKAFEALGGTIFENCPVESVDKKGDLLHVKTGQGVLMAKALVYATHIPPGINLLHFRNAPYRSYAIAVTLNEGVYPNALAYDMFDPYHYYRTQNIDGTNYLIVGGEDHKTAHEANTEACFNKLVAHVRQLFDVAAVTHRWSSQYFEPADGLAYIGHLPGNPDNVYVATGYGGNGITYSHIAAITLTDLLTKGESEYADLFRPERMKPVAGFEAFVKENADVVTQFVAKRISAEKISGFAEIAPGEGRLVSYEGERIAVYKDESGKIYALNPVCTHAKCVVDWNGAEKSWDCPCHGARYDLDGNVLTGPARKNLQRIELEDLAKK
ncbi:FAD-dependent oxidoreductase [Flavisolibacter nicotianae]|uniref:FAD-dependent oxidoreductase n=1 Tax=Flavisolibacter nicotianae TaxID=2364882 RepID=UPI000EAFA79B|nr:FAD-dependent oxidoreductase [Flavisolibacter nicotianae]